VQNAGDSETERTVRVADPVGFTYAFGKLEQAIEELVGAQTNHRRTMSA
jgi:hypothetical protein